MCEFLSHVEVDGKLFYLDDAALRDSFIREALQGCKDNDLLGHGAIRKAFNIPEGKGIDHENKDFWKAENFPEEIANKLKDFDNNFSEVFKLLQNNDLRYIITWGTNEYKEKAWNFLFKNNPSNNTLRCIIEYGTEEYKDKAWKLLLENKPSNDDLCYIIEYETEEYKDKACKLLLENNPSKDNLRYIITWGTDEYKNKACKLLLENMPSNYNLHYILRWGTEKYKEKAQALLNERNKNDA